MIYLAIVVPRSWNGWLVYIIPGCDSNSLPVQSSSTNCTFQTARTLQTVNGGSRQTRCTPQIPYITKVTLTTVQLMSQQITN